VLQACARFLLDGLNKSGVNASALERMMKSHTLFKLVLLILVTVLPVQPATADETQRRQAKRIHDRLTGVPADNATINAMETLLGSGSNGAKLAAELAIQNPAFYNVTLKNFVAPWTNEEQTVFTPLNDFSATVIGIVRDRDDFRKILYDDVIYRGNSASLTIDDYANVNNDHYEQLEALGPVTGNLADPLVLVRDFQSTVTGLDSAATAGVMTSRAGAMAFFSDGTNRAMLRFTLMNQLCTDLEPLKDVSRTPDRIRQDVSRSPGGDSRIFLNSCIGCHAGMDGMAGAFAFYEWAYTGDKATGSLVFTDNIVSEKHLINANNFEFGYQTDDDSWVNYWRNGRNWQLGWNGGYPEENFDGKLNAIGEGAKTLGMELANSQAFAQCQVDKVFKSICLRDPDIFASDRIARDSFVANFTAGDNYDLQGVFTDTAAFCKGD
jgi:hypothetical protein